MQLLPEPRSYNFTGSEMNLLFSIGTTDKEILGNATEANDLHTVLKRYVRAKYLQINNNTNEVIGYRDCSGFVTSESMTSETKQILGDYSCPDVPYI